MSSVDSKRNKMQLLADCILFLLVERGRMPDSREICDFPGVHCGVDRSFSRRALQNSPTKLNAD